MYNIPTTPEQALYQQMLTQDISSRMGVERPACRMVTADSPKTVVNMRLTQSMNSNREIQDGVYMINTYMLCCELILMCYVQQYSRHILSELKERGLYRHNMKKYANILSSVTTDLQVRSNRSDKNIVEKQFLMCFPSGTYMDDYYQEGGNILQRLIVSFEKRMKAYMDDVFQACSVMAEVMCPQHAPLLAEVYMLHALAQTDVELYNECQKQIANIGRGRLRSHVIKSLHSEQMVNAAKNITDCFISRKAVCPPKETLELRSSIATFQRNISPDVMYPLMESSFLALKMEMVEYFITRVRTDMDGRGVRYSCVKEMYLRLGDRWNVKRLADEIREIELDCNETDTFELMEQLTGKIDGEMVNNFRCCIVDGVSMEADTERMETVRLLRHAATKVGGVIPLHILQDMLSAYRTKKEMLDLLRDAGQRLQPTLYAVQAMRLKELKRA